MADLQRLIHPIGTLDEIEWRDSGDGTNMTLRGHAAVFNRLSDPLQDWSGEFREKIAPGAFGEVLHDNPDVRALINHDPNFVLARTTAKTLELTEDPTGLRVWARVAPTSYANDLRTNMQAGNVNQMSFAFTIADETEDRNNDTGEVVRTINRVGSLLDVSVVTYPAYPSTDADMRSAFIAKAEGYYGITRQANGQPVAQTTDSVGETVIASRMGDRHIAPSADELKREISRMKTELRAASDPNAQAALLVLIDSMQSTLEAMDALLGEYDLTVDPEDTGGMDASRSLQLRKLQSKARLHIVRFNLNRI